jgi:trk system potassium uptake protein TrkA
MRIVIGGEDEVAIRLAAELMGEHAVFLVCPESAAGPKIDRLDAGVVYGSVTSSQVLHTARVQEADIFIAATPYDEQNLVACVVAKHLGAGRTVCFLFRPDLRAAIDESAVFAASVGIDTFIRPAEKLAREILRIITVPGALDVEIFEGGKVQLFRHAVEENAPITHAQLKNIDLPANVVIVMVRRGEEIFVPKGNTQLQPGDKVTAMGDPAGMERLLFRSLRARHHRHDARRVTVVGAGEVGVAVALGLEDLGWSVKVIESKSDRCEQIARVLNSLVLHGSGTDLDLLEQENIADDSALVAVTNNDERNLLVSLLAKHLGVPRIITRASSHSNERLFDKVGIDVVRSAQGAAIQSVVRGVVASRAKLLAELEHGDAMVIERVLPAELAPTSLGNLKAPEFTIIGAILRGSEVIIPKGSDTLQGNDRILVFCTREHEHKVTDFFKHELLKQHSTR